MEYSAWNEAGGPCLWFGMECHCWSLIYGVSLDDCGWSMVCGMGVEDHCWMTMCKVGLCFEWGWRTMDAGQGMNDHVEWIGWKLVRGPFVE